MTLPDALTNFVNSPNGYINGVYILIALFFVVALQRMSHPTTARSGIIWAGAAMLVGVLVTFLVPSVYGAPQLNVILIVVGAGIGGAIGYYAAMKVAMTGMPQMVAIYNGMGGGAAAGIAAVELLAGGSNPYLPLAVAGGMIGSISFTGSVIAFLKLQEWMKSRPITWPLQQPINIACLVAAGVFGALALGAPGILPFSLPLDLFFVLALAFGFLMTLPIGGADMPVVISLFNAFTGMAVALDGFSLLNGPAAAAGYAMIIAGTLVGAAGSLLTLLMAKAMNRSVGNVLFGAFGAVEETGVTMAGSLKPIDADDVAVMMAYASKVIIAPGYGMAVAQAQHKVKELEDILESKGVTVKFAIHPVAGRMPGHMNVLLAEAGVPYDRLFDLDEINPEFDSTDVVMVIGANDVVNPAARRQGSALQGMPILDVDHAKNVIVLKRGQGKGFAGIENELFYKDNTRMLYGDAQASVSAVIQGLKKL
jgi:NAD(P) transhydrogenase subunit beta